MQKHTKYIIGSVALAVITVGAIGGAVAASTGGFDNETDTPITGDALATATAVAIEHLGGGRVTGTEVGDEDSYYEVEVTLDHGNAVDVQLDEDFAVVSANADTEQEQGGG